ncbi:MAG: hypothetical protein QOC86_2863, partial [Gaiellales bacterium]|nr:hypothetical protein [Gaiellales bacterium]
MASAKIDKGRVLEDVTLRNRLIRELVERIEFLEGELAAPGEHPPSEPDPHGELQAPSSPGVEPLSTRINRLQATIDRLESQLSAAGDGAVEEVGDPDYARMLRSVRETVREHVPGDATVAVASGGDPELVLLYGRRAVHFPETPGDRHAG